VGSTPAPRTNGSTTDTTALEECKANDRYYGVVTTSPRLLVTIEARLDRVLDLSDAVVRRSLGVTLEELASEDWRKLLNAHRESFGQALGRVVAEVGGHGLLARSAVVPRGLNVAIFTKQIMPTSRLSVVEGDVLEKWVGETKG
jgi:RES domain-containing protein